MKHLRETFTDTEFGCLKVAKESMPLKTTWHEFIMYLQAFAVQDAIKVLQYEEMEKAEEVKTK